MNEQEQTIRRYYELVDAADYDAMLALFAENVVYERANTAPIQGLDRLRAFYLSERIIQKGHHTVETVVGAPGWVAVRGVFEGILKSGQEVTTRWADFHHFENGKITRRYTYFADQPI